ncbi:hypothetical protein RQP46_002932 [Phenoliferia psychrophenolica]
MDRIIADEVSQAENLLLEALVSGNNDAFEAEWACLVPRISSALDQGWLSDATLGMVRDITSRVATVARGVCEASATLAQAHNAARDQARGVLAKARTSSSPATFSSSHLDPHPHSSPSPPPATATELWAATTPPPSSRAPKPSLQWHREASTPTSAALAELNAFRPLRLWFLSHLACPWPTNSEKAALASTTSLAPKKIADWFTNNRRRSGWGAFQKKWAHGDRDEVQRVVRDLEQPLWAGVRPVDDGARADLEKVREYFGERERTVDEDVKMVLNGIDAATTVESYFPSSSSPPPPPHHQHHSSRIPSFSSSDESGRNATGNRSVSSNSSLLSYDGSHHLDAAVPFTPSSSSPHHSYHSSSPAAYSPISSPLEPLSYDSYLPPNTYPSGDIPVDSLPTFDTSTNNNGDVPLTSSSSSVDPFLYISSASSSGPMYEPSPYFTTLVEHPFATLSNNFWELAKCAPGVVDGYGGNGNGFGAEGEVV